MSQLISKHSVTVSIGSVVIILSALLTFILKSDEYLDKINNNEADIKTMKETVELIPGMNMTLNNINEVINDNFETKPKIK